MTDYCWESVAAIAAAMNDENPGFRDRKSETSARGAARSYQIRD